jgi:hypothetical protein
VLVLRDKQLAVLALAAAEPFVVATAGEVERRWPDVHRRMGRDAVCAAVRDAIRRCDRYGFDEPAQVRAYVDIMFALGDTNFDANVPWARDILLDDSQAGSLKTINLQDALARHLASSAAGDDEESA